MPVETLCRISPLAAAALVLALVGCATLDFEEQRELGRAHAQAGEPAAAAAAYEAALEQASLRPVPARPLVATLSDLGELYRSTPELGQQARGLRLLQEAAEVAETHLDPHDATRVQALERLARAEGRPPPGADESRTPSRPERRRLDPGQVVVEPNVLGPDGIPRYVHYTEADMPLIVAVGRPDTPALHADEEQTRAAAIEGFRAWERAVRLELPWFQLEVRERAEDPHVRVRWSGRPRGYLPARGHIELRPQEGASGPRVRSEIVLSAQPVPTPTSRVTLGEMRVHAMHAFGSALGLVDCWRCESIMSLSWRRADPVRITERDVATLAALTALPVGTRAGPSVGGHAGSEDALWPIVSAASEPGVLADLPFLNTGLGGSVQIDLAPEDDRSLVLTLDTGAVDTVLTTDYARAMGISVRSAKSDAYRRNTVAGRSIELWAMGQRVVGGGRGPTHFNYALLGGQFLKHFVVEIDFSRRRVRLLDPDQHRVGDLPDEAVVDLELRELRPYGRLEVGEGAVWALLDTGADGPIATTEEKARELGVPIDLEAERVRIHNVLGTQLSTVQQLDEAHLGGFRLESPRIFIGIASESQVRVARWLQDQTLVGIETLQSYRMRFDYPRQKLGLRVIENEDAGASAPR